MLKLATRSLETFKKAINSYPPEHVTFMVEPEEFRRICGGHYAVASALCRYDKQMNLLPPDQWVVVEFCFNPKVRGDVDESDPNVIESSFHYRRDAVKALKELGVSEKDLEPLNKVTVKKLKEIVDESDEDVDFVSVRTSADGPSYQFVKGDLAITVKSSKEDRKLLRVTVDYTQYLENLKKAIMESVPEGVPFLDSMSPVSTC